MTDETTNTPEKDATPTTSPTDDFIKAKAEFKEENDRREKIIDEEKKLQADKMLSGDSGGHVDSKPAPEQSPEDYVKDVMEGKIDGKEE